MQQPENGVNLILNTLPDHLDWAIRGGKGGFHKWLLRAGPVPKDLDLWAPSNARDQLEAHIGSYTRAVVSRAHGGDWLQHTLFVVGGEWGSALLDVTFGDLKVGPFTICAEHLVEVDQSTERPILRGVAAVADLCLRPLLRGKIPSPERVEEARSHWFALSTEKKSDWLSSVQTVLGSNCLGQLVEAITTDSMDSKLAELCKKSLRWKAVRSPHSWKVLWSRRKAFLAGRNAARVYKRPHSDLLIMLECSGDAAAFCSSLSQRIALELQSRGYSAVAITRTNGSPVNPVLFFIALRSSVLVAQTQDFAEVSRQVVIWPFSVLYNNLDVRIWASTSDSAANRPPRIQSRNDLSGRLEFRINRSNTLLSQKGSASKLLEDFSSLIASAAEIIAHEAYIDDLASAMNIVIQSSAGALIPDHHDR